MPTDEEIAAAAAAEDAAFASGFPDTKAAEKPAEAEKPADQVEPGAAAEPEKPPPPPEYVQISKKDWEEVRAAAAKTASYDQQLSKAFGTIGNLQKLVNNFQSQAPGARKVEIPKDAFAAMERDFPELAQQTRAALEAALSGVANGSGAGAADAENKLETMLASYTKKREVEALEDVYPEWRTIVGAVDIKHEQPPADNPFRKWLATKAQPYQDRVNGTESAAVISRAIRMFQNETKAKPPPPPPQKPRDDARAERIRAAVQPRGDGAARPGAKTEDEEFREGFASR